MITTGYALLRYSASTPEYEGKFSHIVAVSDNLQKLTQLKDCLSEQNSGSYSDYFVNLGDSANDTLGGIHVSFSASYGIFENQLMEVVNEHQMIDNAVNSLISNLEIKYLALKEYFE